MTLAPWPQFDAEQINAATRVLASGKVNTWTGQDTTAFEQEFAQWCGTAHAIAMANGSLALSAAYLAIGLGPGDELITTPRTFIATACAAALENQLGRPARIGCLGLAFKPDVDDLRESPALHITTELLVAGLEVLACEPNLHDHPTIKLHSLEQVLADADLLVFLVAHTPFKGLDLTGRTVFDLCGVTEQDGSL